MDGVNSECSASRPASADATTPSFQRLVRLMAAVAAVVVASIGEFGGGMERLLSVTAAATAVLAWRYPHRAVAAAVTDLTLTACVTLWLNHTAVIGLPVVAGVWHAPILGRWRAAALTGMAELTIVMGATVWGSDGAMGYLSVAVAAGVAAIAARKVATPATVPGRWSSAGTGLEPFVNALGARAVTALDSQSPAHADIAFLRRVLDAQLGEATAQAVDAGAQERCMERMDPAARLERACQAYAAMARERGVVLQCVTEADVPERALVDASALDAVTGRLVAAATRAHSGGELLLQAGIEHRDGQGAARLLIRPLVYGQHGAASPSLADAHRISPDWHALLERSGIAPLGDTPTDGIALTLEPLGPCSARRHLDPGLMELEALILGRGAIATATEAYLTALGLRTTVQQGPEGLTQDRAPDIVIVAPGARASRQCERWCARVRERFPDAVTWCQASPDTGVREGIDVHGLLTPPVTRSTLRALAHAAKPFRPRQPAAPSPDRPPAPAHRSNGERVLLAEDDAISARVVARFLERVGCQVAVRGDGAEALAALQDGDFDLALIDMHLPGVDGIALTRRWRAREARGARLPMIALTGRGAEADRVRCREAGMDAFLQKPVSANALYAMLSEFLPWSQRYSPASTRDAG